MKKAKKVGPKAIAAMVSLMDAIEVEDSEDAATLRTIRHLYLSGGPDGFNCVIGMLISWEKEVTPLCPMMGSFVRQFSERFVFAAVLKVAEALTGVNEPKKQEIIKAVKVLRGVLLGEQPIDLSQLN
jgi:hypothetical protein